MTFSGCRRISDLANDHDWLAQVAVHRDWLDLSHPILLLFLCFLQMNASASSVDPRWSTGDSYRCRLA